MKENANPYASPQEDVDAEHVPLKLSHRMVDAWQDDGVLVAGPNCELSGRCVKCNAAASRGVVLAPATLWQCRFRVAICFVIGAGLLWVTSRVAQLEPIILSMSALFTLCVSYVARMESNAQPVRFSVCDSHFKGQRIVKTAAFVTTLVLFVVTFCVIEDLKLRRLNRAYSLQEMVVFSFFVASTFFHLATWLFWFDPTTVKTDGRHRWIRGLDSSFLGDLPKWEN